MGSPRGHGTRRPPFWAFAETARQQPGIDVFATDVRGQDAPEAIIRAAVGRWGRLDVVTNNADPTATWLTGQIIGIDGGLELV